METFKPACIPLRKKKKLLQASQLAGGATHEAEGNILISLSLQRGFTPAAARQRLVKVEGKKAPQSKSLCRNTPTPEI